MKPIGYLCFAVASAVMGFVVLAFAQSNDDVDDALARADLAITGTTDQGSNTVANLFAAGFFIAAVVLLLIAVVGLGVRAGRSED